MPLEQNTDSEKPPQYPRESSIGNLAWFMESVVTPKDADKDAWNFNGIEETLEQAMSEYPEETQELMQWYRDRTRKDWINYISTEAARQKRKEIVRKICIGVRTSVQKCAGLLKHPIIPTEKKGGSGGWFRKSMEERYLGRGYMYGDEGVALDLLLRSLDRKRND